MAGNLKAELPPTLQPGEPAPDFTLPAIHKDGILSLAQYRGQSPVLLAMFRGLYCPFCRRGIAQLGMTAEKLKGRGVETLAVVATEVERARLYFRYRPSRLSMAADPQMSMLRAFRVPKPEITPEMMEAIQTLPVNPTGELSEPKTIHEVANQLNARDGFEHTPTDNEDAERQFPQLVGQFLLDRTGIIRWVNIEGAEGLTGLGKFPTDEEFLAAAARVS